MRTLVIDLETAPHLSHIWSLWDQRVGISQVEEWGRVICFGAKWHGQKKIRFHSEYDDGGHEGMIRAAHDLIDQADAVVHYNGKAFDMKHLQREMVLLGMDPPSPHHDIDLLTAVRKKFKFASNKLDHVAQQLGLGSKVPHNGFELWTGWLAGDETAVRLMTRYCKNDVKLTEELYDRLLPWIPNHPNRALIDGKFFACPTCSSSNVIRRGYRRTTSGTYQAWQCQACGRYAQSAQREDTTMLRNI